MGEVSGDADALEEKISNEYELSEIISIFGSIVSLATIFFLPKISLYLFCSYAYKVNFAGLLHG